MASSKMPWKKAPQSAEGAAPALTIEEVFRRTMREEFQQLHVVQRLAVAADEVCGMLGISLGGVRNLVAEGKLTPLDIDSRMRFNIKEVEALAKKKKEN